MAAERKTKETREFLEIVECLLHILSSISYTRKQEKKKGFAVSVSISPQKRIKKCFSFLQNFSFSDGLPITADADAVRQENMFKCVYAFLFTAIFFPSSFSFSVRFFAFGSYACLAA